MFINIEFDVYNILQNVYSVCYVMMLTITTNGSGPTPTTSTQNSPGRDGRFWTFSPSTTGSTQPGACEEARFRKVFFV